MTKAAGTVTATAGISTAGRDCMALIKAIDAYLAKADDKLSKALDRAGFADPKGTVDAANRLEDRVADVLEAEGAQITDSLADAESLEGFAEDVWPDVKAKSAAAADLEAAFADEFEATVPKLADAYIKSIDRELKVSTLTQRTVDWARSWSPRLGELMKLSAHDEMERLLANGLQSGQSVARFTQTLMDSGIRNVRYKARRAAITEMLRAHSVAQQEALTQNPAVEDKEWRHTGSYRNDPRPGHAAINGSVVPKSEGFTLIGADGVTYYPMYPRDASLPAGESVNCFPGGTFVLSPSGIHRSFRHWYSGDLVEVITAGGIEFASTPNHPILTDKGWVGAAELDESYDLVVAVCSDALPSVADPHPKNIPARIDSIHSLLKIVCGSAAFLNGDMGVHVNFHGDIPHGEVEVVPAEGLLRDWREAFHDKMLHNVFLEFPDFKRLFFGGSSVVEKLTNRGGDGAPLCVSGLRNGSALIESGAGVSEAVSLCLFPQGDSEGDEVSVYDRSTDLEMPAQSVDGRPVCIEIDKVVSVKKVKSFKGHVYNLQTENGYYLINRVPHALDTRNSKYAIAHNCHCFHRGIASARVLGLSLEERRRLQQEAIDADDGAWRKELDARSKARSGLTSSLPDIKRGTPTELGRLNRFTKDEQIKYMGGKRKWALYKSGVIADDDMLLHVRHTTLKDLNSEGIITINTKTLNHSNVGDFTPKSGRMISGGHGQANLDELGRRGIDYKIEKTYANGVRIGGVDNHKKTPKQKENSGQSWFPDTWSKDDILVAGTYVANAQRPPTGGVAFGDYGGVRVGIVFDDKGGGTVYPDKLKQPLGDGWEQIDD